MHYVPVPMKINETIYFAEAKEDVREHLLSIKKDKEEAVQVHIKEESKDELFE